MTGNVSTHKLVWVEYAKAMGIVLVVYGHTARGAQAAGLFPDEHVFAVVDSIIYSFHMPLFFFLSGLFFAGSAAKRGPLGFIANKFDTLFYPYVIWSVLQGSIESLLSHWTNGHAAIGDVAQLLWHPRAQMWFLYALFSISILAVAFAQTRDKSVLRLIFLLSCAAFLLQDHNLGLLSVAYVMGFFVYFILGTQFEASGLAERIYTNRRALLIPTVAAFVLAQLTYHFTFGLTYKSGGVFALALAVISIAAIVVICMYLSDTYRPLFALIGSASLVIYLLHICVSSGTRIVLAKVLHWANLPVILVAGTVLAVLIPVAVFSLLQKTGFRFLFTAPPRLSLERLVQSRSFQTDAASSSDAA